jgi:hypothetical protein
MPRTGEKKFIDFKVNCLREPYVDRDIQMKFIFTEKGTWFPAPCNGCEMMDGHDECNSCVTSLTLMFFKNPDLDISRPLILQEEEE